MATDDIIRDPSDYERVTGEHPDMRVRLAAYGEHLDKCESCQQGKPCDEARRLFAAVAPPGDAS